MPDVYKILADAAEKWPDKTAVYDTKGQLTFGELYEQCNILKEEIIRQGVSKGKGLGVLASNSREFIIGLFAGIGSGATVMPLSHQLKENELQEVIKESGLHAIMDDHSLNQKNIDFHQLDGPVKLRLTFTKNFNGPDIAPHVDNPAFIRFTSGTTGKAKGVVISHQSVYERIEGAQRALELSADDIVIWVLPMAYHFIASIALYVYCGAAIVITDNFMASTVLKSIKDYGGTLLYASPMHLRMLASDKTDVMIPTMKRVISTSTSISYEICQDFLHRYNKPVTQAYGIIEIGLPIINKLYPEEFPESVGTDVEGYSSVILDEAGNEVAMGTEGLLAIQGHGMFDAYLNPPLLRQQVLKNGYFHTADMAVKDVTGRVFVKGRTSSVINISGNKVFPEEVESIINTLPQIRQSRIHGVPHPLMGRIVQADIVVKEGHDIKEEDLISFCRKKLSPFKIPQRVKRVSQIEMTDSGKIKRY